MTFTHKPITQIWTALLLGAVLLFPAVAWSASCCGGGSASSLVLPKFSSAMIDLSFDIETYNGFWDKSGNYVPNPEGSDLKQFRLNTGYAHRFASRWQGSVILPYVWNENNYTGVKSSTNGVGDAAFSFWYEAFDNVMCVWKVRSFEDLKPATYFGLTLTIPTGLSPYDDIENSFDVTGRGFYRLDGTINMEKTIYPWTAGILLSYGTHFERAVNREYGNFVKPYQKTMGDRKLATISAGYTYNLSMMDTMTMTIAYSDLAEEPGTIDGQENPATGFRKRSTSATLAYSNPDKDKIYKIVWNHSINNDGWGENFPTTEIITLGATYVFR